MEGRRVEGVFLDTAIQRNRAYEAYETAKVYEIRILSRVPEALLSSLGDVGGRLKATVTGTDRGKIILMLENGYEVEAENRLSIPVSEGEELTLILESKNPLTLRVERSFSGLKGTQNLLNKVLQTGISLLRDLNLKKGVENSGLFYERRVWDFIKEGLDIGELTQDEKYSVLRYLEGVNTSRIEEMLRNAVLSQSLRERVGRILELLKDGRKIEFFRELSELEGTIISEINRKERELEGLRSSVRTVMRTLVDTFLFHLRNAGVRVSLRENALRGVEENPKGIDVLREALRSLEEGRTREFIQKLTLLGVDMENPEVLSSVGDGVIRTLKDLVRGASQSLSLSTGVKDPKELSSLMKKLSEEVRELRGLRDELSGLPEELKAGLEKLEMIATLQSYLIASGGRRFILPFSAGGRGFIGFSLRDIYRIFIGLNLEEGFLGVVVESPKKDNPDSVSVLFRTDVRELKEAIESRLPDLRSELEGLNLEVRKLEVVSESQETFELEVAEEFGGKGFFNLRV